MVGPTLAFAQDVLAAIADRPADVVVPDYLLLGAYLGAERAALPTAALIHHIYPFPAPGLPPFGLGFQPAKGAAGRLRDTFFRGMFTRFYGAGLPRLNVARGALGLAPLVSVFDLFARLHRSLVLTSPAFDFQATELPGNVRYVGTQREVPAAAEEWQDPWAPDDQRPLVAVSFSTTFQRQGDAVRRVVEALAALPVRGLVTAGPALQSEAFALPPNVVVQPYLPHHELFPRADLVITHGGHGTVLAALTAGVPVLCLPMGRDQADIAARAVYRGVGLRLAASAKAGTIRRSVQRMLAEPRFQQAARRLARSIGDEDSSLAVTELEALTNGDR